MTEASARLGLPYLQPGQAQKELFHNEALALLDAAVDRVVEAVDAVSPPSGPTPGQCWALAATPGGAWGGHAFAIACWTDSGWRFVPTRVGTSCWSRADGVEVRRSAGGWTVGTLTAKSISVAGQQVVGARAAAIPGPAGGGTVDAEARAAVMAILGALRTHGLIA